MKRLTLCCLVVILIVLSAINGCSSKQVRLEPTRFSYFLQNDFDLYIAETRQWLRDNRVFRSNDPELEIQLNSPFEIKPQNASGKAVLLIHGLSDSPHSFSDISKKLADNGFLVRSLLLPGHGGKPEDLMLPTINDWLSLVEHHTRLLMNEVDEVWLAGFSTGANLALIEAINNTEVKGVVLFSPAIVSSKKLVFLAPIAKYFVDWADIDPEENITRFDSLTMNAAALYYQSSEIVRELLDSTHFERPAFFALSEHDSVVDSDAVYNYFKNCFTHQDKQMLWFGERQWEDEKISFYSMHKPAKRISTGSHMSVVYAPYNPFYGEEGSIRICNNGQNQNAEAACRSGAETWFSTYGYVEENKIHARLTWNPHFDAMMMQIMALLNAKSN